ncbi:MAG: DsbC family protein [Rhodocyclaceae bacterium]|nr:DsbC family protein [Rhodocyclaceae bacterium]
MKKLFAALMFALPALAFSSTSFAGEAEARKAAENFFGDRAKIDSVRKSNVLGLFEVQIGPDVFYVDDKGQYAFFGDVVDLKSKQNLTEERKNKLSQIKFSDLPLNLAIKQVRGNGKRVFVSFEDPNCGYCKRFAKETQNLTDVTIYIYPFPILSADSYEKSRNILCAADQNKAWNDWMVNNVTPPTLKCDSNVDKIVALGQKLNVRGTPNFFLADGSRIPGAIPLAQLESRLNAVTK